MHGSKLSNPVNARTFSDLLSYLDAIQAALDKAVLDGDFDVVDRVNEEFFDCLSALRETAIVPDVTELAQFRQIKARHADAQDTLAEIIQATRGRSRKVKAAISAYSRV
jgi:DNA-binding GntR family transcriptional regulator